MIEKVIEVGAEEDLVTEKATAGIDLDLMKRKLAHPEKDSNLPLEREVVEEDLVVTVEVTEREDTVVEAIEKEVDIEEAIEKADIAVEVTEKADTVVVTEKEVATVVEVTEKEVDIVVEATEKEVDIVVGVIEKEVATVVATEKVVATVVEVIEKVVATVVEATEKVDMVEEVGTVEVKAVTEEDTNVVNMEDPLTRQDSVSEVLQGVDVLEQKEVNIAELKVVLDSHLEEEELHHLGLKLFSILCSYQHSL